MAEFERREHYISAKSAIDDLFELIQSADTEEVAEIDFTRLMLIYAQSLEKLALENLDSDSEFAREPLAKLMAQNSRLSALAKEKREVLALQFDGQRATRMGLNEYDKHSG